MNDIITIIDENNEKKDYKLLLIIDKDFKFIIYTDIDNNNFKNNLYVVKVKALNNNEEVIPITESEWDMIENEFDKYIKKEKV